MALTLEQQAAQLEAKLARIRGKQRSLENGQKIILGGMLLAESRRDPRLRKWILTMAAKSITRDVDKKRLAPLLEELAGISDVEPAAEPRGQAPLLEEPRSLRGQGLARPAVPQAPSPAPTSTKETAPRALGSG